MNKQEVYKLIEQHYRDNHNKLVARYSRFTGSKHAAEDVVQEGYMRACNYWEAYPEHDNIDGWVNTLMTNCLKDNRKAELMHGMGDFNENVEVLTPSVAIPRIILQQVQDRISAKEPAQRKILTLFLIKQYRPQEIQQLVPENPPAIRQIVHRFREELRNEFNWVI